MKGWEDGLRRRNYLEIFQDDIPSWVLFLVTNGEENARIHQSSSRGMSAKEYSLKITQLFKYAPSMVADSKAKMNKLTSKSLRKNVES